MSRVSYFQRFSQAENHATNNTLLVLRHFYQHSPFKIENVLNELLEDTEISIGLTFEQQISGTVSVPDALIAQKPLRVFFETKRGGALDSGQIRRHFASIAEHPGASSYSEKTILIGLTKEPIAESESQALSAEGRLKGILFAATTFTKFVEALRKECKDFERELSSVLDDYEEYLDEQKLSEEQNKSLVVFPCGVSAMDNEKFGIYYEPPSRPSKRNNRFIGIYKKKTVAFVGKVEAIAIATKIGDGINDFSFEIEAGTLTDDHKERIKRTISETPYYNLQSPHRYYVVDKFAPTNFKKTSAQGIMNLRYLDLSRHIPNYDRHRIISTEELAEALKTVTWE